MNLSERKFFKIKKANNSFLCALCSAPRQMRYKRSLSVKNYFQLTLLAITLTYFLYPVFGMKTVYLYFIVWLAAEITNKALYRSELPCPYCGFDATWYKRDVRVARTKVEEFWSAKNATNNKTEEIENIEANVNNQSLDAQSSVDSAQI